jgi:hypothetical protein
MNEVYFKSRFKENKDREIVWKSISAWLNKNFIPANSVILDLGAGYCNFINNVKCKEKHALDQTNISKKSANNCVIFHLQKSTKVGSL